MDLWKCQENHNRAFQRQRQALTKLKDWLNSWGAMDETHRATLRQNWVYLIENLIPDELADHLLAESIITNDMYEEIRVRPTKKEKITHLLFIIQRRGPHAFEKLLAALRNTEQEFIADQLLRSLNGHQAQPMQL